MPRRHCGQWSAGLVLLHSLSDALAGASYFAIPAILIHFARRRFDVPFRPIFWLFGAFIFACGLTHVLEIVVFYSPAYRLIGAVKLATENSSAATAAALLRIVPRALALRGPRSLEQDRQLEMLVELSREAQRASDPADLASRVAAPAACGLGVGLCSVFGPMPGRGELQLVAGIGWHDGPAGSATVPARVGSLARFAAEELGTVVGLALEHDDGAEVALFDRQHDAICGPVVTVHGSGGTHGILVAFAAQPRPFVLVALVSRRPFVEDELGSLRSVAALFGSNLGRIEAERALRGQACTDGLGSV